MTWPELRLASLAILIIALSLTATFGYTSRLRVSDADGVSIPAHWNRATKDSARGHQYTANSYTGITPRLSIAVREATDSANVDFQMAAAEASEQVLGFKPITLTSWDQFRRGAMVLNFTHQPDSSDSESLAAGTLLVAPLRSGKNLVAWVTYSSNDLGKEWDLARIAQSIQAAERDTHSR